MRINVKIFKNPLTILHICSIMILLQMCRIYFGEVYTNMQMIPRRPPGRSDRAYLLALFHSVADLDINRIHMHIGRSKPVAVLYQNRLAVEKHVFGHDDDSVRNRPDGRPARRGNVNTQVRIARNIIYNPARSEYPGNAMVL